MRKQKNTAVKISGKKIMKKEGKKKKRMKKEIYIIFFAFSYRISSWIFPRHSFFSSAVSSFWSCERKKVRNVLLTSVYFINWTLFLQQYKKDMPVKLSLQLFQGWVGISAPADSDSASAAAEGRWFHQIFHDDQKPSFINTVHVEASCVCFIARFIAFPARSHSVFRSTIHSVAKVDTFNFLPNTSHEWI